LVLERQRRRRLRLSQEKKEQEREASRLRMQQRRAQGSTNNTLDTLTKFAKVLDDAEVESDYDDNLVCN
jgi:hypothetical protein